MTPNGKAALYGVLTTGVILLVALLISTPNEVTLLLAVAFGIVVAFSTAYHERQR